MKQAYFDSINMQTPKLQPVVIDGWTGCYSGGWKGVIVDAAFAHPAKVAFRLAERIYEHAIEEKWCADGQLGAMPEGTLAVSSPPFPQPYTSGGGINKKGYGPDGTDKVGDRTYQSQGGDRAEGNLERLKDGGFDLAVTSPPFEDSLDRGVVDKDARRRHARSRGISNAEHVTPIDMDSQRTQEYGSTEGNIGNMRGGFQAAISSSPYEGSLKPETEDQTARKQIRIAKSQSLYDGRDLEESSSGKGALGGGYGTTDGNTGAMEPDTFWSASRTILEQLYSILSPGAHAIFIVKAFVRNRQIVDFPGQWAQLCEAVGFKLIHDHHAMLTEHSGTQGGMFGEDKEIKVKRVSFFRRLHEKRAPETEIFWENVLCFVKPK